MKRLLLSVCAVALMIGISPARQDSGVTESPAITVLRSFLDAVGKNDYRAASQLLNSGETSGMPMGSFGNQQFTFTVKAARAYGNEDETVVVAEIEATSNGKSRTLTDTFRMKKIGENWRILADPLDSSNLPPPSIIALILAQPAGPMQQARGAAVKTQCLSNIKQLGLGTLMYMSDYDDMLPDAGKWRTNIMPYVKNNAVFKCPADKSGHPSSYRMNVKLHLKNSTAIESPAENIMLLESEDGKTLIARHNGIGNVCFSDGHAKGVAPSAVTAKALRPY